MEQSSNHPIGIFDSGVGGLGVTKAIVQLLPNEDIVYVADNKNMPFGQKTDEQLLGITEKIAAYLVNEHNVKLVVIACNTATVSSIAYLRSRFSVPFVGVVPVVKPACEQTKTKCVAILSTPVTAGSMYIQDLIGKFGQGVQVLNIGCPGLADLVEAGQVGTDEMETYLKKLIALVLEKNADVIGLCSTHYPFVRDQLQKIVGTQVTILDSNVPVANQVKRVLEKMPGGIADKNHQARYRFFVTKQPDDFKRVAQKLVGADLVANVTPISL